MSKLDDFEKAVKDSGFVAGIAYSAAIVTGCYDEPTIAKTILTESGISKEDFRKHSDEYDWNIIKDIF